MPVNTLLQMRRGTASSWTSANPTLEAGEWGYETDTGRAKVGDGSTVWNSLKYTKLRYDDIITGSGISVAQLTDGNSQVTGLSLSTNLLAGDNITLSASNGAITINGQAGITLSEGTGIHIVVDGDNHEINVSGLNSTLISDFNTAVDARVTAGTISDESIRDIMSTGIVGGTGILVSYDDDGDQLIHINMTGLAYSGHTHVLSNITDVSATAIELNYLDGTTLGSVTASNVVAVDANKDITGFRDISLDRNLVVGGNLTVQGTTTTVNSTTVDIGDNIIQVNVSGAETLGGIQVLDHDNTLTHQLVWDIIDSRWEFINTQGISPNIYTSGNLSANILTSTVADGTAPMVVTSTTVVTNLNSDKLDNQDGSYYLDWQNTNNKPDPIITGTLTGDITGSSSVTLTDLSNGILSIDTSIAAGSIVDADISSSANINVSKLSASGITLGNTVINLGNTSTAVSGMTSFAGTSSASPVRVYWALIDGGTP